MRLAEEIEGVTVSGGEPLQQLTALSALVSRVKRLKHISVIVLTGYTWQEVQRMPRAKDLLLNVDVLIAGRYKAAERVAEGLRGSGNKTVHLLTSRYTIEDLKEVPPAEIIVGPGGEVTLTGVDPLTIPKTEHDRVACD
jgi:anaerobic ribonucleoside-triphosphate reductase activating protein